MDKKLLPLIQVFSDNFVALLKEHLKDNLLSVVLFGSVVRKKIKKGSDLDYLIILKKSPKSYSKRCKVILPLLQQAMNTAVYEEIETIHAALFPTPLIFLKEEIKKHPAIMLDMTLYSEILFDPSHFFKEELNEVKKRLIHLGSRRIHLPDGSAYWKIKPDFHWGEEINI